MTSEFPDPTNESAQPSLSVIEAPAVTFDSVTFSDGTMVDLDPNDIVVLVGPNNSGKSLALHELEQSIGSAVERMVIKAVSVRQIGTSEQLLELLNRHGRKTGKVENLAYTGFRFSVPIQTHSHLVRHPAPRHAARTILTRQSVAPSICEGAARGQWPDWAYASPCQQALSKGTYPRRPLTSPCP